MHDCNVQEWLLGFPEESQTSSALLRHHFPSKLGGRPAWLNPHDVPPATTLLCPITHKPMLFVCQVRCPASQLPSSRCHAHRSRRNPRPSRVAGNATLSAPRPRSSWSHSITRGERVLQLYAAPQAGSPEDHDGAFHRSLFLFVSPSAKCIAEPGAVKVLRCQLPRANDYYAFDPSDDVLPLRLPPDQEQTSLERDAWRVVEAERDLKRGGEASAAPPLLKEWMLAVEPNLDRSVRCRPSSSM